MKNIKTIMTEIEENTKKRKDTPCLWTGKTNIVKMFITVNRLNTIPINTIPIKIPFLADLKYY